MDGNVVGLYDDDIDETEEITLEGQLGTFRWSPGRRTAYLLQIGGGCLLALAGFMLSVKWGCAVAGTVATIHGVALEREA